MALGMAMARSTKLARRLAWVDRTTGEPRCLLRWPARLGLAGLVLAVAGVVGSVRLARAAAQPADKQAKPADKPATTPTPPNLIEVIVRAKDTGKPLEGASIRTLIAMDRSIRKTDRNGRARIILFRHATRDTLNIDVWADGYVQQRHSFAQHDARYPKIPSQVTIELLPGEETLGGKVVDEQGHPISRVKVEIWGYLGEKKQKDEAAYHVDAITNDQGQWRCRCFRSMTFAYLYLSHPDYLGDSGVHARTHGRPIPSDKPQPDEKPMQGLRDFSDLQVMTRGVEVAGEVRNKEGKPIANAEVGWLEAADWHLPHDYLRLTTTDKNGRFRFPHARPGELVLQAKAGGFAPELVSVVAKEKPRPVTIVLEPGRTLTGRVVNSQGRPILGAWVMVGTWRRYSALGVYLETDADGRFRWTDAPADPVLINASHAGFRTVVQQRASPDNEVTLTLKRSLSISGRVRDAKTKNGINEVEVDVGTPGSKPGAFTWGENFHIFAHQGRFQANVDVEQTPEFRLLFRASGYEQVQSRTFRGDEGQVEYDVELAPTTKSQSAVVAATVRRPDGNPLADAEVAIAYPGGGNRIGRSCVEFRNGKLLNNLPVTSARTDASGRFSLEREPDPVGEHFAVIVVHPDFCAELSRSSLAASGIVEAKPWGRIEGVARVGGEPAAGASIRYFSDRLGSPDEPAVSCTGVTKTDPQGRFVFERVLPGDVRVAWGTGGRADAALLSSGILVLVKPGETAQAPLGGTGRPVIARIALPPGFDPDADYVARSHFTLLSDRPFIPYPRTLVVRRQESVSEWSNHWWASNEGHEYRRRFFRLITSKFQRDGTIRVEDVPPVTIS